MESNGGLQNFPQLAASPLFPLLLISLRSQKNTPDTTNEFKDEYDFIVVGAGAAGSVVAGRLSEVPCANVLLLEAGRAPSIISEIPGVSYIYFPGYMFWNYTTVAYTRTGSGLRNGMTSFKMGRGLGGSTSVNDMLYSIGNHHNYDEWASLGAKGWSYDEVLPYFKKLEDNQNPEYVANGYHGTGGPVTVARSNYNSDLKKSLLKAISEMGYEYIDSNGRRQYGFYDLQNNIRNEQRCGTAKAYLVPNEKKPNLDIVTNALVTKITFSGKRATGVEFERNGITHHVIARKEIIVSAGSLNTATLLMTSGIGPAEDLTKLNIPVVANLPVGKNLQNHFTSPIFFQFGNTPPLKERLSSNRSIANYIVRREGPLAACHGLSTVAFLSANDKGKTEDKPDYELLFSEKPPEFVKNGGFTDEIYKQVFKPYEKNAIFSCYATLINPKSRGTIRLRSANPKDLPIIDPNVFEDQQDFEHLVQGMKNCYKVLTSPAMVKAGTKIYSTSYPGCKSVLENLDEAVRCSLKTVIFPVHHWSGSAKMGKASDPTTVLDHQLRVKSVKGLRVADASVMPTIPWGNINVATIMVGEKAADMIKETIKCL